MNNNQVSTELCSDALNSSIMTQEVNFVQTPENDLHTQKRNLVQTIKDQ
jgi:hypothetical protein